MRGCALFPDGGGGIRARQCRSPRLARRPAETKQPQIFMTTPQNHSFTTQIVHADRLGGAEQGAIHQPIHTSVQYGYDKVEDLIAVFQGTAKGGFNYARQGTPTTA
eukprot:gene3316-4360_t